jgi:tRNA (guanosine-2'-O-)-methyltransferase
MEHLEMLTDDKPAEKRSARKRADEIKDFRCKNLIVVIEDPENPRNIGTVIRTVNALGADKVLCDRSSSRSI